ncbi:MAG TPA: cyclic nucleotide-binding domain-containing protein [Gaiellaceae bacterium]|nr:cyclic nucleotide-binding domain-containing protein [Gaiellaceae bacterium]
MSIFAKDPKRDELRRVPLFAALPRKQFDLLVRAADIVEFPAGRDVIREGDNGHEFFAIADGEVAISKRGRPIATESTGDVFGEIALLRGIPRTATVTTTAPTRAFVLTAQAFRSILAPSFAGAPLPPDVR